MTDSRVLVPGRNCWRIVPSKRVSFLVDAEAYFSAFVSAVARATHTVYIVGWDVDSRIRLLRNGGNGDSPWRLGTFLNRTLTCREALQIYVLDWDFAMLYALDREPLPLFKFGWDGHRRLHFRMDGEHPLGASHHQKLVVIDDRVAFCGGIDLAAGRWDTPRHDPDNPCRRDNGRAYPPFHDVQMMVDGAAAHSLGELARLRWERAGGKRLPPPPGTGEDPWPEGVVPDIEGVDVGIIRTQPAYLERPQVAEVRDFYRDAIRSARFSIYIENQYFTAQAVGETLAARLREEEGPEVIIVLPRECSGWLEAGTMGVLQARLVHRLREADHHGRLRVYFPEREGLDGQIINVHAKVLVVDDRLVRVGSSNLNNRSMGLDTECDLAVEALDDPKVRSGIVRFRNRLLGEHLGVSTGLVDEAAGRRGSFIEAVESLRGGDRSLKPFPEEAEPWLDDIVPQSQLLDPERPVSLGELMDLVAVQDDVPEDRTGGIRDAVVLCSALALLLLLAGLWWWTPLKGLLNVETLASWWGIFRHSPAAPLIALAGFVIGGLILFPVTLLILAMALMFGPFSGFALALAGSLASALSTYSLGRLLGRERVRRVAGGRLHRISRRLARSGVLPVVLVRMLPVAPFSVVNMVAGASRLRLSRFLLGTALGMTPGILAITVFEEGLGGFLGSSPGEHAPLLFLALMVLLGTAWFIRRRLRSMHPHRTGEKK